MSDDRPILYAIVCLGLIALSALGVGAACVLTGRDVPAGVAAVAGSAVGALAGLIPARRNNH